MGSRSGEGLLCAIQAQEIIDAAVALEKVGAVGLFLTALSEVAAKLVTDQVGIPTIGIGYVNSYAPYLSLSPLTEPKQLGQCMQRPNSLPIRNARLPRSMGPTVAQPVRIDRCKVSHCDQKLCQRGWGWRFSWGRTGTAFVSSPASLTEFLFFYFFYL